MPGRVRSWPSSSLPRPSAPTAARHLRMCPPQPTPAPSATCPPDPPVGPVLSELSVTPSELVSGTLVASVLDPKLQAFVADPQDLPVEGRSRGGARPRSPRARDRPDLDRRGGQRRVRHTGDDPDSRRDAVQRMAGPLAGARHGRWHGLGMDGVAELRGDRRPGAAAYRGAKGGSLDAEQRGDLVPHPGPARPGGRPDE